MDLKQRIGQAESAIAKVQHELALLHTESQTLQRQGHIAPNSTEPTEVTRAAKATALAQVETQRQLAGVNNATAALQAVLKNYLKELAQLRQLEQEAQQLEEAKAAKSELERAGSVLTKVSAQLEQAMLQVHQAGLRLNRAQGIGGSPKYEIVTNQVPTFVLQKGISYISPKILKLNQDLTPLGGVGLANPGLSQQRAQNLEVRAEIDKLELVISEQQEELAGLQLKHRSYGSSPTGVDKQWAESVAYAIAQKKNNLQQMAAELETLKGRLGATHAR